MKNLFQDAVSAQVQGNMPAAMAIYHDILSKTPGHAPSLNNLAAIHIGFGEFDIAIDYLEKSLIVDEKNSDSLNNLGILLARTGRTEEALKYYHKALQVKPNDSEILTNLGSALKDQRQLDEAEGFHKKAIQEDPKSAKAYNNIGVVYKLKGDIEKAVNCFIKSAQLEPNDEQVYFNLGESLAAKGSYSDASALAFNALKLFPDSITTIVGCARIFIECGQWENADPLIRAAVSYDYSSAETGILRHLILFLNASSCSRQEISRMHSLCGSLILEQESCSAKSPDFYFSDRFRDSTMLRVGYISSDFRRHSVGWFFKEIIKYHNKDQFEIFCYSLSEKEDDLTREIMDQAKIFRKVGSQTNREIRQQIYDDRIQILVDLAGYTSDNRIEIMACKSAPVQVTAIGYPHGTGLETMDYRISDKNSEGPDFELEYTEKIVQLPEFFLPLPIYVRPEPVFTKSQMGIPDDSILFVSFNSLHKLRPEVLQLWNKILHNVPNSYLAFSFKHSEDLFLLEQIEKHFSIQPGRLIFLSQEKTEERHRARYLIADIALDPFPYSGTTTSWEALSMGVPVITLKGERHVQLTTHSMLQRLNLPFLSVDGEEAYIDISTDLALNPEKLHSLKTKIISKIDEIAGSGNRSYVRNLEKAFNKIRNKYLDQLLSSFPSS